MTTIFVAKLDFGVTENELLGLFQQYGTVAKVTVAMNKETNTPRGFAFVEMPNAQEAEKAISAMDGYSFNGRKCVVKEAEDRSNNRSNDRTQRGERKENTGFRPNNQNKSEGNQRSFQKPSTDKPKQKSDFSVPVPDEDDETLFTPEKTPSIKKKKEVNKPKQFDDTADGKNKKPKMNAYKKSGKDSRFDDDEDWDEELDLFGREEDEELDDDYSKYIINQEDDEEDWEDDDTEDEDWEDDDDQ